MTSSIILKSVALSWAGAFEVIALFPDRLFRKSVHIILWPKESWFNVQYLKFFRDCDSENVEVVVHCARNFLPIASLIGHRIIMQRTRQMQSSVFSPNSKISSYGFDWKLQQKEWGVERWELGVQRTQRDFHLLPTENSETMAIAEFFFAKPLLVEQAAIDWFNANQRLLPECAISVELKCRWSTQLIAKLNELREPSFLGIDKRFQYDLISNHGCDQFFLSIQLLAGLFREWSFIALHGAASVLSLLSPTNLLLGIDPANLTRQMIGIRSVWNSRHYGVPTLGPSVASRDFANKLAANPKAFRETILQALENRQRVRPPSVIIEAK